MIRVDPSPILYFFYSIRAGPSRLELIQPGLAVRVDPVRLLYLPEITLLIDGAGISFWNTGDVYELWEIKASHKPK